MWWLIRCALIWTLFVLGTALAWVALDDRAAFGVDVVGPWSTVADCTPASPERLSAPRIEVALAREEMLFAANDVLRMRICEPGMVSFSARGSAIGGLGPYLVVASGPNNLWEGYVVDEAAYEIPVTEPGWLTLAFVNDAYLPPQDRNLWISQFAFVPLEVQ